MTENVDMQYYMLIFINVFKMQNARTIMINKVTIFFASFLTTLMVQFLHIGMFNIFYYLGKRVATSRNVSAL